MDQLKDNMGCVAKQLSDDQMKRLDEVSAIPSTLMLQHVSPIIQLLILGNSLEIDPNLMRVSAVPDNAL